MSTGKVKKGRGRPLKIDEFILKVILDDQAALLSRVILTSGGERWKLGG